MNYKQMLEKFEALEDQIWLLSQRISQLERDRLVHTFPIQVPSTLNPPWTVTCNQKETK